MSAGNELRNRGRLSQTQATYLSAANRRERTSARLLRQSSQTSPGRSGRALATRMMPLIQLYVKAPKTVLASSGERGLMPAGRFKRSGALRGMAKIVAMRLPTRTRSTKRQRRSKEGRPLMDSECARRTSARSVSRRKTTQSEKREWGAVAERR